MGIEDTLQVICNRLTLIEAQLSTLVEELLPDQKIDRQDKEKAIKDTMPTEMG